jgi:hypothetical protein
LKIGSARLLAAETASSAFAAPVFDNNGMYVGQVDRLRTDRSLHRLAEYLRFLRPYYGHHAYDLRSPFK